MKPEPFFIFSSCFPSSPASRLICAPPLPVAADQVVGRAVVRELRLALALELRDDPLGELLPQLDAPLVERIDVPDDTLRVDAVLVERDELAERFRRQPVSEDRVRRTVPLE